MGLRRPPLPPREHGVAARLELCRPPLALFELGVAARNGHASGGGACTEGSVGSQDEGRMWSSNRASCGRQRVVIGPVFDLSSEGLFELRFGCLL
mmetsp:Transcript_92248/g.298353  ORF Transcript_92248/g.298353 Transcript_92248/m.298353 type:complete len:95 (+) Transcript_92248:3243-3527(+)